MRERTLQLVLQYDGAGFSGWQRQRSERTVQGVLEEVLARICGKQMSALGAGRTDAGVHAIGQSVGLRVPPRWEPPTLRRALNALLPDDIWVAAVHEMRPSFHARFSATMRRYSYVVGTDDATHSPFRRRWEWAIARPMSRDLLDSCAEIVRGEHAFRAFAVRGSAPDGDHHRCTVSMSRWRERPGGLALELEANRFLHHMVRFLVATMVDVASGRRDIAGMAALLEASDNRDTSPPAPAHALFLEEVRYPLDLYLEDADHSSSMQREHPATDTLFSRDSSRA